jgi:hypothetical protein
MFHDTHLLDTPTNAILGLNYQHIGVLLSQQLCGMQARDARADDNNAMTT